MEYKDIKDLSTPLNGETRYGEGETSYFHMDGVWWRNEEIVCEKCGQHKIIRRRWKTVDEVHNGENHEN
jgi:hypothetical protein